jgi:hypothetical protein
VENRNWPPACALSKQHSRFDGRAASEGTAMTRYEGLTREERARITDIQNFLIERFVERKEAIEEGQEARAK